MFTSRQTSPRQGVSPPMTRSANAMQYKENRKGNINDNYRLSGNSEHCRVVGLVLLAYIWLSDWPRNTPGQDLFDEHLNINCWAALRFTLSDETTEEPRMRTWELDSEHQLPHSCLPGNLTASDSMYAVKGNIVVWYEYFGWLSSEFHSCLIIHWCLNFPTD